MSLENGECILRFLEGFFQQLETHVEILLFGDRGNDMLGQFRCDFMSRESGNCVEQFAHLGRLPVAWKLADGQQVVEQF